MYPVIIITLTIVHFGNVVFQIQKGNNVQWSVPTAEQQLWRTSNTHWMQSWQRLITFN